MNGWLNHDGCSTGVARSLVALAIFSAIAGPLPAETAGTSTWKGRKIEVKPATRVTVTGEEHTLTGEPFRGYQSANLLRHVRCAGPGRGMPVLGALDPASLVVRHGDRALALGRDYLCDSTWAALRLGPEASITSADEVSVDYRYSLRRIDSLVRTADGRETIVEGQDARVMAKPPELAEGQTRLANIYADLHCNGRDAAILPISETAGQAKTATVGGRLPKAMAKIKAGRPVTIVCWGDSVTNGGDASAGNRFTEVFAKLLGAKFPGAPITVRVVAIGGSSSPQWLQGRYRTSFERIVDAKPDVVAVEFVNDYYGHGDPIKFRTTYDEMLKRFRAMGTETILITPHFVWGIPREKDSRAYVGHLKAFAEEHELGIADASARWEHLWKEGIPYITYLANNFNHPDDRGHRLFAEELIKCFEP